MEASEIKKIRKTLDLSQKKFAELCGVGLRTVQYWETGERDISKGAIIIINQELEKTNTKQFIAFSMDEMAIYIHDHLPEFENNKTFNMVVDGVIKNRLMKELEEKERIIEKLQKKNPKG